jgi:hypothetical protein
LPVDHFFGGESIMSASADDLSTQNPKILIVTALITAITTIAAAFLGIVPQMRSSDRGQIGELQEQIERLKQATAVNSAKSDKMLNISGTVLGPNAERVLGRPDVFLIPLSNPKLMAATNANGQFHFNNVPDQQYWIIVRDPKLGKSGAGFMDKDNPDIPLDVALVQYKVEKAEK